MLIEKHVFYLLHFHYFFRWFESLKLILSGTTRPTRRGRVFNNMRPRKPQLSRHYRNVSVSLTLHNLQVSLISFLLLEYLKKVEILKMAILFVTIQKLARLMVGSDFFILFQLYAVSRTLQGRQREPSVKTLRSPLSAEFWRHCVLNGRTQRRAQLRHQSEEMEI